LILHISSEEKRMDKRISFDGCVGMNGLYKILFKRTLRYVVYTTIKSICATDSSSISRKSRMLFSDGSITQHDMQ